MSSKKLVGQRRPYQVDAVKRLPTLLREHGRVIAVSPTGSGKTRIGAMLIASNPQWRRILWIAHREELVLQARKDLVNLGLRVGVIMAAVASRDVNAADPTARVQVASPGTLLNRDAIRNVDLIVFDEAHRTMADSYQKIAAQYPRSKVLGLTATAGRMDSRKLTDFYAHTFVVTQPSELYAQGYLMKPRTMSSPPEVLEELRAGMRGAKTSHGDYTTKAMSKIVDKPRLIGRVIDEAVRLASGVRKVVFACSIKHSQRLVAGFKKRGIVAEHLDGETDGNERAAILARLGSGEIEVVCNVDVLTEGFDCPAIGAVIVARPTRSKVRFMQMAGRCMRISDGKGRPLVLDHGGNFERLNLDPSYDIDWSIEGSDLGQEAGEPVVKVCERCLSCIPAACTVCPDCALEQPIVRSRAEIQDELNVQLEEQQRAAAEQREALKAARREETKVCADAKCGEIFKRGDLTPSLWGIKRTCSYYGGRCALAPDIVALRSDTSTTRVCKDSKCGRVFKRGDMVASLWAGKVVCKTAGSGRCALAPDMAAQLRDTSTTKKCVDVKCARVIKRLGMRAHLWAMKSFCRKTGPRCALAKDMIALAKLRDANPTLRYNQLKRILVKELA